MARKCKCVCRRKATKRTTRTTKTKAKMAQFKTHNQMYVNGKKRKGPYVNIGRRSFKNATAARRANDKINAEFNRRKDTLVKGKKWQAKTARVTKLKTIKKGY